MTVLTLLESTQLRGQGKELKEAEAWRESYFCCFSDCHTFTNVQFLMKLSRNFSKNEGATPDWCMTVADWCENMGFFFYYFWLLSCFTSTNTWLHSRKNTLGALHRDAFGRVMLRNMTDGFQTKSKFEERVAERVAANDGWSSQLLQHTELVKHHTGRKCKKRKQLAEKHTMSSRLRWGECAVTSAEMPRSFGR